MRRWDESTDVIIVGSGAGAMTAAIKAHDRGLKVSLFEKASTFGGTSAMSGGAVWVPCNHLMHSAKIDDDYKKAFNYLKSCIGSDMNVERVKAYLNHAPDLFKYLEQNTQVCFTLISNIPNDYYPQDINVCPYGRSLFPVPFPAKKIGKDITKLRKTHPQLLFLFGLSSFTHDEGFVLSQGGWPVLSLVMKILFKSLWEKMWHRTYSHLSRLCMGSALVARLYASLTERKIPIMLESSVCDLISEGHKVEGVVVETNNKKFNVQAKMGVILATGGFAANQEMRNMFLRKPTNAKWSNVQSYDQGEGIQMAARIGADLELMYEAWWCPVILNNRQPYLAFERSFPGAIVVNQSGKRFTNEEEPYNDFVLSMYKNNQKNQINFPSYLIMDHRCRKTYPLASLLPASIQPHFLAKKKYKNLGIKVSDTCEELAEKLGIDVKNFCQTISNFNKHAEEGHDPEFGRGESFFELSKNDASIKTNPYLSPIKVKPYYGLPIFPGDLGTKGGLHTDAHARVIHKDGQVIQNLYATGNCTASMMGSSYPGAGSTLGPSMVFGSIAVEHIASHHPEKKSEEYKKDALHVSPTTADIV